MYPWFNYTILEFKMTLLWYIPFTKMSFIKSTYYSLLANFDFLIYPLGIIPAWTVLLVIWLYLQREGLHKKIQSINVGPGNYTNVIKY